MVFGLDIVIILIFLALNLGVGLYWGKGIKNVKEYAIGERNFSTATIAATIVATWMMGSNIAITSYETYANGIFFVIPALADVASFFIIAYYFAPKMSEFLGRLSVADAMGGLYGKKVRAVTAISAIIPAVGNVAMQLSVLSLLLSHFLGVSSTYAVVMSSFVVIAYSTFGGIKAVTFTDMIQFFTFGIMLPMTAFLIWRSIDSSEAVLNVLAHNPSFDLQRFFDYHDPRFLNTAFLFLFFLIPGMDPALFQRISMAKNTAQVTRSFIIAGFSMLVLEFGIIAFCGLLLLADNAQNLTQDTIAVYILDNYMTTGFKGLFVIGVMAMLMSTADSYINSSAILISHDLSESVGLRLSEGGKLMLARISALIIGVSALMLSLFASNLMDLILITYGLYMPIVSPPFILAICGFRTSSKIVLSAMLTSFIVVATFRIFSDIGSLIPGMAANCLVLVVGHYLFGKKNDTAEIQAPKVLKILRSQREGGTHQLFSAVRNFDFITFCKSNEPHNESIRIYLALFCIVSAFSNIYSLPREMTQHFGEASLYIYVPVLLLSTILITYPIWLSNFQNTKFISVIWNISILYSLIFVSAVYIIMSNFNQLQLIVLMSNLVAASILLRWQSAIMMIFGGVIVAYAFCALYLGENSSVNDMGTHVKIVYSLFITTTIMIAFLKPKQEDNELAWEKVEDLMSRVDDYKTELYKASELKYEFLRNLQHESHTPITGITSMAQAIDEVYDKLPEARRRQAIHDIAISAERLESYVNNLIDLSKLSSLRYDFNFKPTNLSYLVSNKLAKVHKLYTPEGLKEAREFVLEIEQDVIIECDEYYMGRTIENVIINAIQYCKQGRIEIRLHKAKSGIEFSIKDEGVGIPQEDLKDIFGAFTTSSKTRTPAGGRGVGLALSKSVIDLHNGIITAESDGKSWTKVTFIVGSV